MSAGTSGRRLALAVTAALGLGSVGALAIATGAVYAETAAKSAAADPGTSDKAAKQESSSKSDEQSEDGVPSGAQDDDDGGGSAGYHTVPVQPGTGRAPDVRSQGS
ncbi:hypothetical protein LVY72_22030 [Arthrobacter sp. I2-34]|uniref:CAP domain-containing protein n=1 Tax=Arthrobacter hankyongi TaxID=2904801 RepID=A0ABS9LDH6_9MICC|nr:hypothetical protein [Arthrobacter hankyongi]MCG2624573.1 hypothetical protein [Arthrobacter hankyongi]